MLIINKFKVLAPFLSLLFYACEGEEVTDISAMSTSEEMNQGEQREPWWAEDGRDRQKEEEGEQEGSNTGQPSESDMTSKDEYLGKDEELGGKEEFDKDPDDVGYFLWVGEVNLEDGTGVMGYNGMLDHGERCELMYPILSTTDVDGCDICSFAKTIQLGDLNIIEGGTACELYASDIDLVSHFGQAESLLLEHEGVDYYELYGKEDDVWMKVGYSFIENMIWRFQNK